MKRFPLSFILVLLLGTVAGCAPLAENDPWLKINTQHFTLVGNASERDIRTAGLRLEQFRAVFAQVFPNVQPTSPVPITVVVFKNRAAYAPFMPLHNGTVNEVAGHFQPSEEVHYITLAAEFGATNPYHVIFHEYVHALTHNAAANLPTWLSEGLAEFYSRFELAEQNTQVLLGAPIPHHVQVLRENKPLSFARLLAITPGSPEYNERDKKGVFYAQSWALVHYLLLGNNAQRQPQLARFVQLLATGASVAECLPQAFQTDLATLEKDFNLFLSRNAYPVVRTAMKEKLTVDEALTSRSLSEAEVNFYLGDLLAHQHRNNAEQYLHKAIQLAPNLAAAQASLGLLRIQAGRFAEAQKLLAKAVANDPAGQNHLPYYYHAMALMRTGTSDGKPLSAALFDPQQAHFIRNHLQRAIAINPYFPGSYRLLAFVNLVTGQELEESVTLLKRILATVPGKQDLLFQLAQIQLRQEKLTEARQIAEPLARQTADPAIQQGARALLWQITQATESASRARSFPGNANGPPPARITPERAGKPDERPYLRHRNRGEEMLGLLTKMECSREGTTLYVTMGLRRFVFHTREAERLEYIWRTHPAEESFTCTEFTPARVVRVRYRSKTDGAAPSDGEPISVEFVK